MKKFCNLALFFAGSLVFCACPDGEPEIDDVIHKDTGKVVGLESFEIDENYTPSRSTILQTWVGEYRGHDAKQEAETTIFRTLTLNPNGTYTNEIKGLLVKDGKDEKTVFEKEKGTYEYIDGTIHYTVQYDSLINYQTQQFIGYNKKHYYSADGNNTSDKANYTEKAMFSVLKKGKRQWVSKDTYLQQLTDKDLDLYFSMDVYKDIKK